MLFTVNELAKILNKHPESIRRQIRSKKLKAIKTSNRGGYLIEFNDLDTDERWIRICNLDDKIKNLKYELEKAETLKRKLLGET